MLLNLLFLHSIHSSNSFIHSLLLPSFFYFSWFIQGNLPGSFINLHCIKSYLIYLFQLTVMMFCLINSIHYLFSLKSSINFSSYFSSHCQTVSIISYTHIPKHKVLSLSVTQSTIISCNLFFNRQHFFIIHSFKSPCI